MAKIKLLTVGNCQMCVISNYLEKYFSDKFDIISCEECNLKTFWNSSKTFCPWSPNNKENQVQYYQCIHDKIAEADVFLFQNIVNTLDKLKTEYLQNEIAKPSKTRSICVHSYMEVNIYPDYDRNWMLDYAKSKGITGKKEIDKFVCESNDPYFAEFMKKSFKESRIVNKEREELLSSVYGEYISMNDFIAENYNKKLLSYQLNHPTRYYFVELITRILKKFNLKSDENTLMNNLKTMRIPKGPPKSIPAKEHAFFRNSFPNIKYPPEQQ